MVVELVVKPIAFCMGRSLKQTHSIRYWSNKPVKLTALSTSDNVKAYVGFCEEVGVTLSRALVCVTVRTVYVDVSEGGKRLIVS